MTIRVKSLAIVLVAWAGLMGISYGASQLILMKSFRSLETEELHRNLGRVVDAINEELCALERSTQDWAEWGDTYAYMKDRNAEFIRKNVNSTPFISLKLNLMLFVDSRGRLDYGKAFDLQRGAEDPLSESVRRYILANPRIIGIGDSRVVARGIVCLPEGPMLLSARPILDNERRGPSRGTLVMARFLDKAGIRAIGARTHLAVDISPLSIAQQKEALHSPPPGMLPPKDRDPIYLEEPQENTISGYTFFKDVNGADALRVRVALLRDIYHSGAASVRYFIITLIGAGVVFSTLILLLLEKLVLSRVAVLGQEVHEIGVSGYLDSQVAETGNDELTTLAASINGMLRALCTAEAHYRSLVEQLPAVMYILSADLTNRVHYMSPQIVSLLGYTAEEFKADPLFWLGKIFPEDRERVLTRLSYCQAENLPFCDEYRMVGRDGEIRWFSDQYEYVRHGLGSDHYVLGLMFDITRLKQCEDSLRLSLAKAEAERAKNEAFIAGLGDPISVQDTDFRILFQNHLSREEMGDHVGEFCFQAYHGLNAVCDGCLMVEAVHDGKVHQGEYEVDRGYGKRSLEVTVSPVKDSAGNIIAAIELTRDISERKEADGKLLYMSTHDLLTGLYNRAFFDEELTKLSRGRQYPVSIIVADLDGLKAVNDTLGHATGDRLIQMAAQVLSEAFRAEDVVSRIGGDEFAVLLPDTDDLAAQVAVERIRHCQNQMNESGRGLNISMSLGVATAKTKKELVSALKLSDERMYRDKYAKSCRRMDNGCPASV
ncbi:MAG: diguanylate cyclase [Geobacter sp.]|nr:diguanylate cyclase [Geobacter sp.]